jgi:hypothetical protein
MRRVPAIAVCANVTIQVDYDVRYPFHPWVPGDLFYDLFHPPILGDFVYDPLHPPVLGDSFFFDFLLA